MNRVSTDLQPPASTPYRPTPVAGVTWGDLPPAPATQYVHSLSMELLSRDVELLGLVAKFGQLTTAQIDTLVFHGLKSRTPCQRAIKRLVALDLLEPVAQRMPGGRLGGSAMNVLMLGSEGWKLHFEGRRKFSRVIKAHSLAIADVYVSLVEEARQKNFKILHYATEPDSHISFGGVDLKPDLYLDVAIRATETRRTTWVEVDLSTERQKQVLEQVAAYKHAYENRSLYPLPQFPDVLFLAMNDERAREIRYWIQRAKDLPDIFTVATIAEFPTILQRT